DDRDEAALHDALTPLQSHRAAGRLRLALGGLRPEPLVAADLIVLSPGVPPTRAPIAAARAAGVAITGEIELASRFIAAPIVGITGTNGKSTVTSLCGAIAQACGRPSFCGGNLGTPLCTAIGTPAAAADGIVVVELSSYQLETAETLSCTAATVLNLTPDHLDRYPSLAAYGDAKGRIFANMQPLATRVWNADDPEVLALCERRLGVGQPGYAFSLRGPVPPQYLMERSLRLGGWVEGAELVLSGVAGGLRARVAGGEVPIERYPIAEMQLVGQHNLANALAALLLMRGAGLCSYEQARAALRRFVALPHRMQLVAEAAGVRFYDDSKGTNVDAVVAGLEGFPRPLALIAGGRDKGGSYAPLRAVLQRSQTRCVVVLGEAAPLIQAALHGCDFPVVPAPAMEAAVQQAAARCQPGDAVVLSPACSSFDMFRDYAHRAAVFTSAALALPGARPAGVNEPPPEHGTRAEPSPPAGDVNEPPPEHGTRAESSSPAGGVSEPPQQQERP
ncbi:MAG TPA: UDP-N-acetylmuramoyl-L-alanine--D-glutamate ligase, partial [Pseudomonadota bacterium]|nr:UDP-N-acetylmuramoyl-L-alanine--D-glutamate ligase [Pseudomonadota bacterium]